VIYITGASGFVGQALVKEALRRGLAIVTPSRVELETPDLTGVTTLIHLAARVHVMNGAGDFSVNLDLTKRLADTAVKAGVSRFIFVSTIKVLGESGEFTRTSPYNPQDPYAKSKMQAELALRDYPFQTIILRPPLIYGASVKANMASLFKLVQSGVPLPFASVQNKRSLLYVGNLMDALLRDFEAGVYNICDETPVSLPALIGMIAEAGEVSNRCFALPAFVFKALPRGYYNRLFGSLYFKSDVTTPYTTQQGLHLSLCPLL
jgi:nucleoside-diphosphate-sugar epimerase